MTERKTVAQWQEEVDDLTRRVQELEAELARRQEWDTSVHDSLITKLYVANTRNHTTALRNGGVPAVVEFEDDEREVLKTALTP